MECTQLSLFGRTCPELSVPTVEKISELCWKNLPALNNQTLLFLDLRGGRWSKAGAICGNGWSLAWRQLDAQYWGVPQRRKRIALVADFGGQRAAEILFERTSLSRNPDESIKTWEATPGHSQASPSGCDRTSEKVIYDARGNGDGKIAPTITGDHENRITDYTAIAIERKTFNEQSFSHYKESDKCSTLKAKSGNIGNGSECLIAEKVIRWIVRRLTPVECERLQGYPDDYTNIGDWMDSKGKKRFLGSEFRGER